MQQNHPSANIEIEIQRLLKTQPSLDLMCDILVKKITETSLNHTEYETVATFLLYCGQYVTLSDLLAKAAAKGLIIPWAHLCESLFLSTPAIPESIKRSLIQGSLEQNLSDELARSTMLDSYQENLIEKRTERRKRIWLKYQDRKLELLGQVEMLRTQGLFEEEGRLIERIQKIYPGEPEVEKMMAKRKQLQAYGVLFNSQQPIKKHRPPIDIYSKRDPEEEKVAKVITDAMVHVLQQLPDDPLIQKDFIIAQVMWENIQAAVHFLPEQPATVEEHWLKFEVLLRARLFVELLDELAKFEPIIQFDAEASYSLLYLKAQALWGLGNKTDAIEIVETILIHRPDYRSLGTLLREWKESLT